MRTLVIGFGNPSRRDDGAGLAVVNGLRQRLGLPILDETTDGFEDLGHRLDTLFLQQLTPELAEELVPYDDVLFVDAHVGVYPELIHHQALPAESGPSRSSHHLQPCRLLALTAQLFGAAPRGELISIRGFDFDFGPELSAATDQGIRQAVDEIWHRFGVEPASEVS